MIIPAIFTSLTLIFIGIHSFNERQTRCIVTSLVTVPFTVSTIMVRVFCLVIIISFQPLSWCLLLFLVLTILNTAGSMVLSLDSLSSTLETPSEEDKCFVPQTGVTAIKNLPKLILKSFARIVAPLGYQDDELLGVKATTSRGGVMILWNYVVVMVGLLLGVSTALLDHLPTTIEGLDFKGYEMSVEIPETTFKLSSWAGLHFKVTSLPILTMSTLSYS